MSSKTKERCGSLALGLKVMDHDRKHNRICKANLTLAMHWRIVNRNRHSVTILRSLWPFGQEIMQEQVFTFLKVSQGVCFLWFSRDISGQAIYRAHQLLTWDHTHAEDGLDCGKGVSQAADGMEKHILRKYTTHKLTHRQTHHSHT